MHYSVEIQGERFEPESLGKAAPCRSKSSFRNPKAGSAASRNLSLGVHKFNTQRFRLAKNCYLKNLNSRSELLFHLSFWYYLMRGKIKPFYSVWFWGLLSGWGRGPVSPDWGRLLFYMIWIGSKACRERNFKPSSARQDGRKQNGPFPPQSIGVPPLHTLPPLRNSGYGSDSR